MRRRVGIFCFLLMLGFVSAAEYIVDEDFGDIRFNVDSIQEGMGADGVDFTATLFPNFENGASVRYIVQDVSDNEGVFAVVTEFQDDISFEDFDNNYISFFREEGDYVFDYDNVGGIGESLQDAEMVMIGILTEDGNSALEVTYAWVSHEKFVFIFVENFGSIDGILETDFNEFLTSYIEKFPSTLVKAESSDGSVVCSETDRGKDYFSKGSVDFGGDSFEDVCQDSKYLEEYFCTIGPDFEPNGRLEALKDLFYCEEGCEDGACLGEDDSAECVDSDGGKNYGVKGFLDGDVGSGTVKYEDYCLNETSLIERFCSGDPSMFTEERVCEEGCENGACVGEGNSAECVDLDGKDFYSKGEIKWMGNVLEDKCGERAMSDNVYEYWCENDFQKIESYTCPNGCANGACIGEGDVSGQTGEEIDGLIYVDGDFNEGTGCRVLDYEWRDSCVFSKSRRYDIEDYLSSKVYVTIEQYGKDFSEEDLIHSVLQDLDSDDSDFSDYSVIKDGISLFYLERDNEKMSVLFWKSGVHVVWIYVEELPLSYSDDPLIEDVLDFYLDMHPLAGKTSGGSAEEDKDEECPLLGYRKGGKFCAESGDYLDQKGGEESCDNSFECVSNSCLDSLCVEAGVMTKILNWFKGLFG